MENNKEIRDWGDVGRTILGDIDNLFKAMGRLGWWWFKYITVPGVLLYIAYRLIMIL